MIKTFCASFILLTSIIFQPVFAQESTTPREKRLPNIPGTFVLEFGFNQPYSKPDSFDITFWGSRTLNIYYLYDIRIGKSKFSVHPGVGFGFERYKLKNAYTLDKAADGGSELVSAFDTYPGVKKSMIVTNYVDIPIEIRFSTNPNDPGRSFRVSIGGRVGYLYDSFAKIKYREDGETKKIKDKQNFYLNDFRYGAFMKIGAGSFTIFSYYNLSPVFKEGKGPDQTDMANFTIGVSLSSF